MLNYPICVEIGLLVDPLIYCYLSSATLTSPADSRRVRLMMPRKMGVFEAFKLTHRHTVDCAFIDLPLPALSEPAGPLPNKPHRFTTVSQFPDCTKRQRTRTENPAKMAKTHPDC